MRTLHLLVRELSDLMAEVEDGGEAALARINALIPDINKEAGDISRRIKAASDGIALADKHIERLKKKKSALAKEIRNEKESALFVMTLHNMEKAGDELDGLSVVERDGQKPYIRVR